MGKTLTRRTKAADRVSEMIARKVDLRPRPGHVGEFPDMYTKLVLELSKEYQIADEGHDYVMVTWKNQEKAQDYFNAHGFEAALSHMLELREANEGVRG